MRKQDLLALVLLALTIPAVVPKLRAQDSLGDVARRIRNGKDGDSPDAKAANGKKQQSNAYDLNATMNLIAEKDPEQYSTSVRLLLEQEKFVVLDDVAMAERNNKTRFPGGEWKLYTFYQAIESPWGSGPGVPSDWNAFFGRLNRWVAQQPTSITPRVSLAAAELMYAQQAKAIAPAGSAMPESTQLFKDRLKQAETTLNQASDLQAKCPEWYDVMMQIGRAEGWELEDLNTLFQRAIAFEPQYHYFYQQQAYTLMPGIRGKEGDAEKFAEESANKIGGKPGGILYWLIAQSVLCNAELSKQPQHFVWSRALVGYQALIEQYGSSIQRQNQIALMAAKFGDYTTADDLLLQLGEHWDKSVWGSQEYFDKIKAWARNSAGPFKKIIEAYKAVNLNIASPEGRQYDRQVAREFSSRFARALQDCAAGASGPSPTLLIVQMGKTGAIQQMMVVPENASDACLRPKLEKAMFSPPPKPEYWVRVNLGEVQQAVVKR
jgi:hypothetical protein